MGWERPPRLSARLPLQGLQGAPGRIKDQVKKQKPRLPEVYTPAVGGPDKTRRSEHHEYIPPDARRGRAGGDRAGRDRVRTRELWRAGGGHRPEGVFAPQRRTEAAHPVVAHLGEGGGCEGLQ